MDLIDRLLQNNGGDTVDAGFVNKSTGQSPYAKDQAQAQVSQAAQRMEPVIATEPARKPSAWDRISSIFARKKLDARGRYLQLLKKTEVDGEELSDKEVADLAHAMETAGVSEGQAAFHRAVIRKLKAAELATQKIQEITARRVSLEGDIEELRKRAEPLKLEEARLMTAYSDTMFEAQAWIGASAGLDGKRQRVSEIFGEAV